MNEFVLLCELSTNLQDQYVSSYSTQPEWKKIDRDISNRLPIVEAIALEVDPRLAGQLRAPDRVITHFNKRNAYRELQGALEHQEEIEKIVNPGPQLAAAELHSWIWEPAAPLWRDGHHRAAVQAAATALFDTYVPEKLGRSRDTKGGTDLMGQAFSLKDPEPGVPRLRIPGYDRSSDEKSWVSAHEGAMRLGQGCVQSIRNITTHDLTELQEQQALEMLAALSLVARLVAGSDRTTAP